MFLATRNHKLVTKKNSFEGTRSTFRTSNATHRVLLCCLVLSWRTLGKNKESLGGAKCPKHGMLRVVAYYVCILRGYGGHSDSTLQRRRRLKLWAAQDSRIETLGCYYHRSSRPNRSNYHTRCWIWCANIFATFKPSLENLRSEISGFIFSDFGINWFFLEFIALVLIASGYMVITRSFLALNSSDIND